MNEAPVQPDAIERARAQLKEGRPPPEILALVADISEDQPAFRQAQHVRGVCALRQGDPARAKTLLIDAIERGESTGQVWLDLTAAAAALDLPDDALSLLLGVLKRVEAPKLFPFAAQILRIVGFGSKERTPRKDAAFTRLVIPILSLLLERREMDGAMALEGALYENYVKPTETETHFAWCMEHMAPLFTEAGRAWRRDLPPLPQPALTPPYKVGFFIHAASMLAHIEVLLNTLKGYRMLDEQPFEPTVYCFSGKSVELEQVLAGLGVRLVMLNERFPETGKSDWQRLLRLRNLLSEEGVQELVWVSLVTMLPLAFSMRIAPVQTWWAMKYRNFSHDDIDGYVSGSALTRFGTLGGRRWRMAMLGVDDWYDAGLEDDARALRLALKDQVVVASLARTEKMGDPAYLNSLATILRAHPQAVLLWAGREERPDVVEAFRAAGVLDRTRFIGWVNTRLYAQVTDIFLDTFPFPCGFTLFQAMAAGKPVVLYDSPEAAQTGLWNFLKPLVDGDEGTAGERAELRSIIGGEPNPLISIARTPADYVRLAGRLIDDQAARGAAGDAARRFIARYFSDPRAMARSYADHFVDLIEGRSEDDSPSR